LLELVTDDGLVGIGEAGLAYGMGGRAAAGMVSDLVEAVLPSRDLSRIEELWSDMYDHSFWAKGGLPFILAGISAIEQALWDIKGKSFGVPIYEVLGGMLRDRVRVYANGWSYSCTSTTDYARAAERTIRDGYNVLKCYPLAIQSGTGGIRHVSRLSVDRSFADLAVEKVKAVRDAVGATVDIMVDLSGGLTTDQTIRLCRRLERFDLFLSKSPPIHSTSEHWKGFPLTSKFPSCSARGSIPAKDFVRSWKAAQ